MKGGLMRELVMVRIRYWMPGERPAAGEHVVECMDDTVTYPRIAEEVRDLERDLYTIRAITRIDSGREIGILPELCADAVH
jgi:hypothetical protein